MTLVSEVDAGPEALGLELSAPLFLVASLDSLRTACCFQESPQSPSVDTYKSATVLRDEVESGL